jgi:S1-C subfamily serine protease
MTPRSPSLPAPRQAGAATPRLACRRLALGAAFAALIAATAAGAAGGTGIKTPAASKTPAAPKSPAAAGLEADQLFAAVVKVQTRAVPDARSSATLGPEREGSGIVIGDGGLILTIGYLLVEADDVSIVDARGRTLPAQVIAYDHATGLGLVKPVVPFDVAAMPLGDSTRLREREPMMIVNAGGADDVTLAFVVSKRGFTASWEYLLDQAIFTSPPAANWSGAALVGKDGRLYGVGSLIVRDASAGEAGLPGNMFVPIDALKPILDDMVRTGRRAGPPRPWLGVAADEVQGRLVVSRVSPDGPADEAGIEVGDIILAVAGEGVRTQADFYRKVWGRGAAGSEVPLRVLQGIDLKELKVKSIDRVDYFRPRTMH